MYLNGTMDYCVTVLLCSGGEAVIKAQVLAGGRGKGYLTVV